ncbi:IS110 family transposase, partial [Aestuariibacter salexigens]|uniref:IS110 family transposase n=1 Tax=Aestuariibacter salexigens TaxID=226010 RepID=UPI00047A14E1
MYKGNVIAIDIAKSVFQVCALDKHNNIKVNREIRRQHLVKWLTNQPPSLVALEACGSAHFWAKEAIALGHQAIIISARFAKNFLHGHKTDKNDAVAIGIAAR